MRKTFLLLLALAPASLWAQTQNATFVFVSTDSNTTGFNDPTPRSAIESILLGDNPGATLGEIRQNVLTAAGARWSAGLLSNVPIRVEVDFEDLGGSGGGSISLAGAAPATVLQNFSNAPLSNTLYPIALANSLAGRDLSSQPDIRVTVNSNAELSNSQSGNFTWYYGFDSNGPANTIDFLDVIAHELGHGLGFISNESSSTGAFIGGQPYVYSTNIFDTDVDLTWPQMSSAQRFTSSRSDPHLTWNGPNVTGAINGIESFVSRGSNTSNSTNLDSFDAVQAAFGGTLDTQGLEGVVALVDDGVGTELGNGDGSTADLAQDIQNGAEVSGKIALIVRGLENFDAKVRRAEDAGAIGAIVYNNIPNDPLVTASASGTVTEPTIPMVFVSLETGNELRDLLDEELSVILFENQVTLTTEDILLTTRLRLFGPSVYENGSSVSHWTTSATPNLLMEPTINSDILPNIDLSILLMKDIGWNTQNITIPHLTYDLWLAEEGLDNEPSNIAPDEDFDGDGISNLEEYYHGTDPQERDPTYCQIELSDGTIQHQRATLPNDLTLEYQQSENLSDFTTFAATETTQELGDQLEEAEINIDLTEEQRFFRLSIQALNAE